ncbi:MAG: hypothetical protein INQ03_09440 [Candidatus Heimdallarchaeota archaeon]|nr:hypothetical protein [Candidatus Heimdallarchaeota archaeon]
MSEVSMDVVDVFDSASAKVLQVLFNNPSGLRITSIASDCGECLSEVRDTLKKLIHLQLVREEDKRYVFSKKTPHGRKLHRLFDTWNQ